MSTLLWPQYTWDDIDASDADDHSHSDDHFDSEDHSDSDDDSESDNESEPDDDNDLKKPNIASYQVFQRTDKDDPRHLCLQIVDRKLVSCVSVNSEIYRATLQCDGQADRDVICKVVFGETNIMRLFNEADFYSCELEPFQGKCVPVCHGLFEFNDEDRKTGILVLDYAGKHLVGPTFAQPWELRYDRIF